MSQLRSVPQAKINFLFFQDIITSVMGILILITLMLSLSLNSGDPANLDDYADANCAATPRCNTWATRVQTLLPGATGGNAPSIAVNNRVVQVTIRWQQQGEPVSNHTVLAQIYRATD